MKKVRKRKIEGQLEPVFKSLEEKKSYLKFINNIKEGQEIICDYNTIAETRTLDMNARLWKLYTITFNSQIGYKTVKEIHLMFGEKYLSQTTLIDSNQKSLFKFINDYSHKFRAEEPILKMIKRPEINKLQIVWVHTTSTLKLRRNPESSILSFPEFMEYVENDLASLGIYLTEQIKLQA